MMAGYAALSMATPETHSNTAIMAPISSENAKRLVAATWWTYEPAPLLVPALRLQGVDGGDAIEMASNKTKGTGFSWLALILAAVVLALLILLVYSITTTIPGGPLPYNETQTLPTTCCSGGSPVPLTSVAEITIGTGLILVPIFLWPVIRFRNESPFASFWRRIEESNAKKTVLSKDQMKGALPLLGVVILLAVSMYFVGFLVH